MASITINDVDERLRQRLEQRAAAHGRSPEAEALGILERALGAGEEEAAPDNLYDAIRAIVEPIGGIEIEPLPRHPPREPVKFE